MLQARSRRLRCQLEDILGRIPPGPPFGWTLIPPGAPACDLRRPRGLAAACLGAWPSRLVDSPLPDATILPAWLDAPTRHEAPAAHRSAPHAVGPRDMGTPSGRRADLVRGHPRRSPERSERGRHGEAGNADAWADRRESHVAARRHRASLLRRDVGTPPRARGGSRHSLAASGRRRVREPMAARADLRKHLARKPCLTQSLREGRVRSCSDAVACRGDRTRARATRTRCAEASDRAGRVGSVGCTPAQLTRME